MSLPSAAATIHLVFLGCPKNRVDSEAALVRLRDTGYQPVAAPEQAGLVLVNTCAFLAPARAEAAAVLDRLAAVKRTVPGQRLVVTGCLASLEGEALRQRFPAVDLVIGSERLDDLPALLSPPPLPEGPPCCRPGGHYLGASLVHRSSSLSGGVAAYLKIGDGCRRSCSFCLIPTIKGPPESRPAAAILAEARSLLAQGVRELVLVGQDPTRWQDEGRRLPDLVRLLARLEGLVWLRLLYLFPGPAVRALLPLFAAEPRLVPYLDVPLQHVDSEVLGRMNRPYGEPEVRALVADLRAGVPGLFLRSGFILGHPGEGEGAFARLRAFVGEGHFQQLSLFPYSDEPGTASHGQEGKLPPATVAARHRQLEHDFRLIRQAQAARLRGRRLAVLLEQPAATRAGLWEGRHAGQAPEVDGRTFVSVPTPSPPAIQPGAVVTARIVSTLGADLWGVLEP